MEKIEVGGHRIAFEKAGKGPAVVLLHGGVSDSREWRRQLGELATNYTVVAWDAPGCGGSSDPPDDFGLERYASCLRELIEVLELENPHVVGLSFGAGLALELYRQSPDLPRSLVLASAYAGWAGSLSAEVVDSRLEQVVRQSELPATEVADHWLAELMTSDASPELIDELREILTDFHPPGMRTMARAFAKADLRPILSEVRVPTLLIYGEADRRSPLSIAMEMNKSIPNSRLVVIAGVSHQVNMEASARFNEELSAFLRTC